MDCHPFNKCLLSTLRGAVFLGCRRYSADRAGKIPILMELVP